MDRREGKVTFIADYFLAFYEKLFKDSYFSSKMLQAVRSLGWYTYSHLRLVNDEPEINEGLRHHSAVFSDLEREVSNFFPQGNIRVAICYGVANGEFRSQEGEAALAGLLASRRGVFTKDNAARYYQVAKRYLYRVWKNL